MEPFQGFRYFEQASTKAMGRDWLARRVKDADNNEYPKRPKMEGQIEGLRLSFEAQANSKCVIGGFYQSIRTLVD